MYKIVTSIMCKIIHLTLNFIKSSSEFKQVTVSFVGRSASLTSLHVFTSWSKMYIKCWQISCYFSNHCWFFKTFGMRYGVSGVGECSGLILCLTAWGCFSILWCVRELPCIACHRVMVGSGGGQAVLGHRWCLQPCSNSRPGKCPQLKEVRSKRCTVLFSWVFAEPSGPFLVQLANHASTQHVMIPHAVHL